MTTAEPPDEPDSSDADQPSSGLPPETRATDPVPGSPSGATWSAATSGTPPTPVPPAPPVTDPDTWLAPAPPEKRRLTWLWVLLGALVLIAVLVVVGVVLFVRTLAGPIDATDDVLAQVKAEHYETAYRISCAQDRELYTIEQYRQVFVNTKDARGRIESYDVNYSKVDGDRAEVRYDLDFADGTSDRFKAEAHKVHGDWRVCLFAQQGGRGG